MVPLRAVRRPERPVGLVSFRWLRGRLPIFTYAAKALQLLVAGGCFMTGARVTLPRGQYLQPVLVGKTSISDDIGRIAVITDWVQFGVLDKFGLFHV